MSEQEMFFYEFLPYRGVMSEKDNGFYEFSCRDVRIGRLVAPSGLQTLRQNKPYQPRYETGVGLL
jgi:hypothetical protein